MSEIKTSSFPSRRASSAGGLRGVRVPPVKRGSAPPPVKRGNAPEHLLLCNIQKFSVHDGPGIRTAFFFKGCPLRCAWCHNPESQRVEPEPMAGKDGVIETVGRRYTIKELLAEAEKDRVFYEQSGGGITLTGGEALAQDIDLIEQLLSECGRIGISTAVDTCGAVAYDHFKRVLPYTDLFLYDIKTLDPALHLRYTGGDNAVVLDNLIRLSADGARINLRLPLIRGVNDSDADMRALAAFIKGNGVRIEAVNLLPYHEFGKQKYAGLGREWVSFEPPDSQTLARHLAFWQSLNYPAAVGGASAIDMSAI